ncbi:PTS system fructose-specific transporter subunit IIA, partial [Mycoplasma putrefaciens]
MISDKQRHKKTNYRDRNLENRRRIMQVKNLFNKNTSFFNKDFKTKDEVIDFLSSVLFEQNFISNKNDFIKAIYTREKQGSTGVGDGIAIPHALNSNVKKSVIAYISLKQPIHW